MTAFKFTRALAHKLTPAVKPLLKLSLFTIALAGFLWMTPMDAMAQSMTLDLGAQGGTSSTGRIIQMVLLLTILTLAPSILIMMTSFTRIVIVLSFLRTAMGTQQTPPNQVLISLALFLTMFIMMPTFQATYNDAVQPLLDGTIDEAQAMSRAVVPFEKFMMTHVKEHDLALFVDMAKLSPEQVQANMPLRVLIPAFMISELKRAFEIGFLMFVPFLIIDMVVASVLMAMGMMMLPPVIIALPFKVIFFVLVDGWYMIVGSLVRSYGGG
ncbi:MAG: flagellar type III secretion system pore protein FliP [Magnetovibrio sp.]|nr:flagellar type III secretion system pore protein FliP [Magnetovibrio sp.]